MQRISHGALLLDSNQPAPVQPGAPEPDGNVVPCPPTTNFDYLFRDLQEKPNARLPDKDQNGKAMAQWLIELGESMTDPEPVAALAQADAQFDSDIPSIYTYFGQFITHEVVFEAGGKLRKVGPDTLPMAPAAIPKLVNGRTPRLDLDSIYGPIIQNQGQCLKVPRVNEEKELEVGFGRGCPLGTDVTRQRKDPLFTARIGDPRNDANVITSQMHLAFLRAHNKFIEAGHSFEEAQRLLRQHFQWLVIHDYLPNVVGNAVLKSVLEGKIDFKLSDDQLFMPVEFSAGVFRFGHSMARSRYNYNQTYDKQPLSDFFLPRKNGYPPVNDEWIIDWKHFLPGGQNLARLIDTRLAQPLFTRLINEKGERLLDSKDEIISLAALDLLRGYQLGLPTGQAVAEELGITPMSAAAIESIAGQVNHAQQDILHNSGLSSQTPLWFYVLAEAAALGDGLRLGPVGSTIVAGVLVGLVRCSTDSILREPYAPAWTPVIGNGHFDIAELFKFAGVLDAQ